MKIFAWLQRLNSPRILFDYIDGGSYSEFTLSRNVKDFEAILLHQKVMQDVSKTKTHIKLFDQELAAPFALAPVGFAGMYARRGETQAAKAAASHNIPFCLSTVSICSVEEVYKVSGCAPWFQLYMVKDRACVKDILQRAQECGCQVLILTADLQTPGARYRDVRSGMMRKLSIFEQGQRILKVSEKPNGA